MKILVGTLKRSLQALAIAGLLAASFSSQAAVDMFLKLSGIDGESRDDAHSKEIDVLAWSEGASNSGTATTGTTGGTTKVSFHGLSVTKYIDSSSPELRLRVANGTHIPEAILTVRKAGDIPLEYFVLTMKNVLISSISAGGSGGEDRLTENVTLNYTEIEWKYVPQDASGNPGADIVTGWNIETNVAK